jgi:hypothetical protein
MFVGSHCRFHYTHINRLYTIPSIVGIVAVVQHVCQVTLSTSLHPHQPFVYIPSIVGGILKIRYQVLLLSCNMFIRSHCRFHYTHINSLYMIPSIVGGILQSRYQVLLLSCNMFVRSHCRLHYTHISTVCIRYQVLLAAYYKAF